VNIRGLVAGACGRLCVGQWGELTVVGGEKHRVLVVDDEPVIADTLALIFSRSGYQGRAAYSAEEALVLIPEWRPELAILDVYLPKMNGIELAIWMKAEYPECRVSLFSGQPGAGDLLAAAGHKFEILAKPMHPSEILGVASRLLRSSPDDRAGSLAN